jgi:uncharacterized membrane protein YbhN (UPF0104 family)
MDQSRYFFWRRYLLLAVKVTLTIAFAAFAIYLADFEAIWQHFRFELLGPALAALGALVLLSFLHTIRWLTILQAIDGSAPRFGLMLRGVASSYFFSQVLPFSVSGDVARVWWAYKEGRPLGAAFNSVVLDRLTALTGIALLMTASSPALAALMGDRPGLLGLLLCIGAIYAGLAVLYFAPWIPGHLLHVTLLRRVMQLGLDARKVFLQPRPLMVTVGVSILVHIGVAQIFFLLAWGMGIPMSAIESLLLVPPVILLSSLPVTLAGWGLREGGMIFALGLIGVPSDAAFALSVMYGLLSLAIGLMGGLVWLGWK